MVRAFLIASLTLGALALTTPSQAGMQQDLEDCTAADRDSSVDACSRVMASGRLPNSQLYIGHYNRGWSHLNAGDYENARDDFDKSLKYNSGYADTYYSRAVVEHELGEREDSLRDLDKYLEKTNDGWKAHFNRALIFRWRGDLDEAFSELRTASGLDPEEHKVAALRALILSDLGEQTPARADAEKVIDEKSDYPHGYYARALVSFREDKFDAAREDAEKAVSLKDGFPAAHTLLGRIAEKRGDDEAAIKSYRESLDIVAKSVDARAAHDEARERLAALGVETKPEKKARPAIAKKEEKEDEPAKVAASEVDSSKCRKFIPAAAITIEVDCEQ